MVVHDLAKILFSVLGDHRALFLPKITENEASNKKKPLKRQECT